MEHHNGTATRLAREIAHHPTGHHGQQQRGLESTASSHLPQGKFGRLFRNLPAAQFGDSEKDNKDNLRKLARCMSAASEPLKDGPDPEESGIPALYTYFGQFVDHDITFDPVSSLQRQNDPDALVDYRTPAFDLDNVYGRGPSDQPYLYTKPEPEHEAERFLLGGEIHGDGDVKAWDLPRNGKPGRALIGDPRNDENVIVSQLQGLFLRFHNWMAHENGGLKFGQVQQLVRFHYQYVVLNDFLPRIVNDDVLKELKTDGRYDRDRLEFFQWINEPFMPVEFSVAAYRMGHSMVRAGYCLNDKNDGPLPIFPELRGFKKMNSEFAIDWGRFIDTEQRPYKGSEADNKRRLQFAYRIDTSLAEPLSNLGSAVSDSPHSLAERNLWRGWRLGLPSGQDVALSMSVEPLEDKDILVRDPNKQKKTLIPISEVDKVFVRNCPLWTYILAEAQKHATKEPIPVIGGEDRMTPKLGPVGGRIVAEVFLGLMFGDGNSMLRRDPLWYPERRKIYKLKDLVKDALKYKPNETSAR